MNYQKNLVLTGPEDRSTRYPNTLANEKEATSNPQHN